jgi:hypothetical protein
MVGMFEWFEWFGWFGKRATVNSILNFLNSFKIINN